MVASNQILKLIETCLLSICLLKMLELSLPIFYGSKLGSRTWWDKTWKGMDWFLVFINSNAQLTRVTLGLYRTDTTRYLSTEQIGSSMPYDLSGRYYHQMVVARAEYLFSAKDWRELNLLTMYLRVLHKQRKISILPLEPNSANLKQKSKLWTSKIYNVTVTDTDISWMAWVGAMKLQTQTPLFFNCTMNLCYSTQSQDCRVTLQENPPSWCNP
jgi:hypothetical protein